MKNKGLFICCLAIVFITAGVLGFFAQRKIDTLNAEITDLKTELASVSMAAEAAVKNAENSEIRIYYAEPGEHPIMDDEIPEKTVMTIEDINNAPFPKGYIKESNGANGLKTEKSDYPVDIDHSLLIGELATMSSIKVMSSGIEDGMIYTVCEVELQDGTKGEVLYINHPNTQQFVAASYTNDDYDSYVLYTFYY